jgi:Tol biopolymer transport system component
MTRFARGVLALLFLALVSCQAPGVVPEGPARTERGNREPSQLHGLQISDGVGLNSEPAFSPAGQLMLYVSRARTEHAQGQIYELNLATGRVRRLTYQNGESVAPAFHATAQRFFFASNTDRLKEESYYLDNLRSLYAAKPGAKASAASDILDFYSSGLDGRDIQKLGSPTLRALSRSQVSVAVSPAVGAGAGRLALSGAGLWLTNLAGFEPRRLTEALVSHPRYSADGKLLVWSEATADGARLMIRPATGAAVATVLLPASGSHQLMPTFNPKNSNEIVFSSDRDSALLPHPQFDLYALEIEAKCLKRLTETATVDETDPVFRPDGAALAFTSTSSGSAQIYLADYKSAAACLPLTP